MKWYEYTTSLFPYVAVNTGERRTIEDVIKHAYKHTHYVKIHHEGVDASDMYNDEQTLYDLRNEVITKTEKLSLKNTLQCWQPSCYMPDKSKGSKPEIINPILCLDFDNLDGFDIDEVKQAIFQQPCVCFVSLSCSGKGLYALLLIEDPEKLKEYAEHCFKVFQRCGIPIDTGKGQNPNHLRFVSHDENPLWREDPIPLKLKPATPRPVVKSQPTQFNNSAGLLKWAIDKVCFAQPGERFETVRKVAFTMGGHGYGLDEIQQVINTAGQFQGVEHKYLKHAEEAFNAGRLKPVAA